MKKLIVGLFMIGLAVGLNAGDATCAKEKGVCATKDQPVCCQNARNECKPAACACKSDCKCAHCAKAQVKKLASPKAAADARK